jgi:hypothetical protein
LVEEGLVRPDFNEYQEFMAVVFTHAVPFSIGGREFIMRKALDAPDDFKWPEKLKLTGPSLTQAGTELSSVVSAEVPGEYVDGFAKWLDKKHIDLFRVSHMEANRRYGEKVPT